MRNFVFAVAVGLLACGAAACRSGGDERREFAPPPADSPLAKVARGMGKAEVQDLIGPPTSQDGHISGKAWIPFYFGGDSVHVIWRYKGEGRVLFSGGISDLNGHVKEVEYDPSETGYERR